jgi:enoyl-CoA hydratase/carnithine racemase
MVEIKISGPAKNALGSELMARLTAELEAAAGEPVLLTGEGDAFCAGLNLKEILAADADGMVRFLHALEKLLRTLYLHDAPTAAAVNGHAIAGGALLVLCCDVRIAPSHAGARIGLNEVALGLRFPPSILRLVQARIAPHHLDEVLLGAGLHEAASAVRLGLVEEIAYDPVSRARDRLAVLAGHPRAAYAAAKRDLRTVASSPADDRRFVEEVLPVWTSPEIKDRIRSFLQKR